MTIIRRIRLDLDRKSVRVAFSRPLNDDEVTSLGKLLEGWKPPMRRGRRRVIDPSVVRSFYGSFGAALAARSLGISRTSVYRILSDGK